MCLIAFALNEHPEYPLIMVANRDEFFARPTSYASYWEDQPHVLAGRDLKGQGTWMGMNTKGKLAAVTNFRDPHHISETARTRGDLTRHFLTGDMDAMRYLQQVEAEASAYNGFNLLLYEAGKAYHYSNYGDRINTLDRGIYGLSNALLDTPWPKLVRLRSRLKDRISGDFDIEDLLALLLDQETAADEDLPQTGVPYEWEKAISSICIRTETYGTCCSTIILINREGEVTFVERSFPVGAREDKKVSFQFKIDPS